MTPLKLVAILYHIRSLNLVHSTIKKQHHVELNFFENNFNIIFVPKSCDNIPIEAYWYL